MKCINPSEIYRVIVGGVDEDKKAAFEHHFSHCEHCAQVRAEVQKMVARLEPAQGEFDDQHFVGDVMTLIRLGRARPEISPWASPSFFQNRSWLKWAMVPLAVAATAALAMILWPNAEIVDPPHFQARGVAKNPDRWVSIHVHRLAGKGYQPVSQSVNPNDTLAFAYTNRSPSRYRFLMIFAVDPSGAIFWYYPAHVNARENPMSIPISYSDTPLTLPEQVRHPLKPGKVRLFGMFSETPLDVNKIESIIQREMKLSGSIEKLSRLSLTKTGQHSFIMSVTDSK